MYWKSKVFLEDMHYISSSECVPWEKLRGCTLLVTGATGLIGSTLIHGLIFANHYRKLNIKVVALCRNMQKVQFFFPEYYLESGTLQIIFGTVEHLPEITLPIDYIIHTACPTSSSFFVEHPVEVIQTSILGTISLLKLAREKKSSGFVYLSSMEAFGKITNEVPLKENMLGYLDLSNIRNSYSESKRVCELLCTSFAAEYGLRAINIRMAQTFGPGVDKDDQRVFAMMARCALQGRDIRLRTDGSSRHSYLYTSQAVTAILTTLLKGAPGNTYNAANPATYCSIKDMGKMVASHICKKPIQVLTGDQNNIPQYPESSYLNLDIRKLQRLGWEPTGDLITMFTRMIDAMGE